MPGLNYSWIWRIKNVNAVCFTRQRCQCNSQCSTFNEPWHVGFRSMLPCRAGRRDCYQLYLGRHTFRQLHLRQSPKIYKHKTFLSNHFILRIPFLRRDARKTTDRDRLEVDAEKDHQSPNSSSRPAFGNWWSFSASTLKSVVAPRNYHFGSFSVSP